MSNPVKHRCVYRTLNDDKKTIVDSKGNCRCNIGVRKSCDRTSPCILCREDREHTTAEMVEILKSNPMEVVEDVFIGRKLTFTEKTVASKFIKKYYTIPEKKN